MHGNGTPSDLRDCGSSSIDRNPKHDFIHTTLSTPNHTTPGTPNHTTPLTP